jgi:hypothetical protein
MAQNYDAGRHKALRGFAARLKLGVPFLHQAGNGYVVNGMPDGLGAQIVKVKGKEGWSFVVLRKNEEVFRAGKSYPSREEAFQGLRDWVIANRPEPRGGD